MSRTYEPYIPRGKSELLDMLGLLMLSSPTFIDDSGYFPERNVATVFHGLNEGLGLIRRQLGDERYLAAMDISNKMRAYFEADPEDKTGAADAGRQLVYELEDLLKQRKTETR